MGVDIHEKRRLNGDADHNPSCRGHGGSRARYTWDTRFTRHHWKYYKAKAERRRRQAKEETW